MDETKGFVTIATGRDEYYRLAANLPRSYRQFCPDPLPFALLADRENQWTAAFDQVILFPGGASNSYLDKLRLAELLPYDRSIFIDSDCLAYGDLNRLFDYFRTADDFSCFGRVLPLEDSSGWFEYKDLGELQGQVSYVLGLHGGVYYLRRGEKSRAVLDRAQALVPDYPKYRFKGKFTNPGDEPLVALAMALNQCRTVPFGYEAICCYWEYADRMELDISRGLARVRQGLGKENEPAAYDVTLVHWGTRYTRQTLYQSQAALLELMAAGASSDQLRRCRADYHRRLRAEARRAFRDRCLRKLKRIFHKA